jgi:Family of unknown function (DUF6188)
MTASVLIESDQFWRIPLEGRKILMFRIDNGVTVMLHGAVEYDGEVQFAGRCTVRESDGKVINLDTENQRDLGPVLACFGKTVERLVAWKADGRLELAFTDGTVIEVPAHEKYEAWEIDGAGYKLLVTPGGELAIWDGSSPDSHLAPQDIDSLLPGLMHRGEHGESTKPD